MSGAAGRAGSVAVFLPTYAPGRAVQPGFRGVEPEPYGTVCGRARAGRHAVPWTYLDAIDAIAHVLGSGVKLVVADCASSPAVQSRLIAHQARSGLSGYDLWLGREPASQWLPFNLFLGRIARDPEVEWIVYTSSDVLWSQPGWLDACVGALMAQPRCGVAHPTVSRVDPGYLEYQQSKAPRDRPSFPVPLANAYVSVFRRGFLSAAGFRYPDVFRNCYSESLLALLLRSHGLHQRIVPRASLAHALGLDKWHTPGTLPSPATAYGADRERERFTRLIAALQQEARLAGRRWPDTGQLQARAFLPASAYAGFTLACYRNGRPSGVVGHEDLHPGGQQPAGQSFGPAGQPAGHGGRSAPARGAGGAG